ncbi:hypothetical protein WJX73_003626 [Symbiochloris irregularis]|uniref:Uncharacterized protein n=1 Tax=Symbiochloris irregularis TaxID=706552 RepID=A0AAW1P3F8_9CHLO
MTIKERWAAVRRGRHRLDAFVAQSRAGTWFQLEERRTNFTREVYGGTVTFMTMAYILAVNPSILTLSGGPCTCSNSNTQDTCTEADDPGYQACLDELRQNLITATAASSIVACFIMGAFANMPVALAPGLGLNAFFSLNVVGYHGSGSVSYQTALAAVFIEGWIFILLSWEEGLGVVTADASTLVTLGGCPVDAWMPQYTLGNNSIAQACAAAGSDNSYPLFQASDNHICNGHKMTSATTWLGLAGLTVMTVLMHRGWKGSVITGILFVTFIAWIPGHGASYLGSRSSFPGGIGGNGAARLTFFKKVVRAPNLSLTGAALDFSGLSNGSAWLALITFLYVDFLDTTGTLFSMANFLNSFIPGFVNRKKQFPRSTAAFSSDGCGIVVGSLMGSSPVTAYIESATGIKEGARTGIAALTACIWFFVALFFSPLIASIPPYATGPAIILVGSLMMVNIVKIRWNNVNESVPAFLTMIVMPLTYSIAYGVVAGLVGYVVVNSINLSLDWVGDRWTDSSAGGDGTIPPLNTKGAGTFADPGPIGLKPMESFGSSYAGSMQDHVDPSTNGKLDMSPVVDASHKADVEKVSGATAVTDASSKDSRPTRDSAVELTSRPMRKSVSFSNLPLPDSMGENGADASIDQASTSMPGRPGSAPGGPPSSDSSGGRPPLSLNRGSIPSALTSAEVEAMLSGPGGRDPSVGREPSETSLHGRGLSGVDMYSTDNEVADRSLGPPRKSVAELYDDLWK